MGLFFFFGAFRDFCVEIFCFLFGHANSRTRVSETGRWVLQDISFAVTTGDD